MTEADLSSARWHLLTVLLTAVALLVALHLSPRLSHAAFGEPACVVTAPSPTLPDSL